MTQEPLLDDIDRGVEVIRTRYREALEHAHQAHRHALTWRESLYAALRTRQALRVAGEVDAPVPCCDCLVEIAVGSTSGAGGYTSGAVHHELIYEAGDLPYATCGVRQP